MPAVNIRATRHDTYARWTLAGVTHAVATCDAYRGGVQYDAALAEDVALSDRWVEEVASGATVSLRVIDRPDLAEPLLTEDFLPLIDEAGNPLLTEFGPLSSLKLEAVDGLQVIVEVVTGVTYDDGTSAEFTRTQTLTLTARERQAGAVVLTLADLEDQRLNSLYPLRTFQTSDFPLLLTTDAGAAVPAIRGIALKLRAVLVSNAAPYRYVIAEGTVTVLTVYRGKGQDVGRVASLSEYTVGTTGSPFSHTYIEFSAEQRDFDGSLYTITADVQTTSSGINCAAEIQTLLTAAGVSVDSGSFTTATTFATTQGLLVDCDHGRGGQRTVRAIIEDLLWVLRATLSRTAAGAYALVLDGTGASVVDLNEDAGDAVEVLGVVSASRPLRVGLNYRPGPRSQDELQNSLQRAVSGGTLVDERPRSLRYVRRHDTADHCVDYRSKRTSLNSQLRLRLYRRTIAVGDVFTLTSAAFDLFGDSWRAWEVQHVAGGVEVTARPYSADLASYTAGTLPADAVNDYQPDYSATAPLVPTGFRITATDTARAGDGTLSARVTADCIPPAVNWQRIWLVAIHNTTGEIVLGETISVGSGRYGQTLGGLRPGEVYRLQVFAENAYGVKGAVESYFDSTAIGGIGITSTFTTAGYAAVPANVASVAATQGMGRLIAVSWPAVTDSDLADYELERKVDAGAYAVIWRGQARSYDDSGVSYGSTYTYRVRARNRWGNYSAAYATSAGASLTTGGVVGGSSGNDIGSSTVATNNRTAVTTISASTDNNVVTQAAVWTKTISHSLGVVPLAASIQTGAYNIAASVVARSSSDVTVVFAYIGNATRVASIGNTGNNNVGGDPHYHAVPDHSHALSPGFASFTVSVDIW